MTRFLLDGAFVLTALIIVSVYAKKGFVKIIGRTLCWVAAFIIAKKAYITVGKFLKNFTEKYIKFTKSLYLFIIFVLLFILSLIILRVVVSLLYRAFYKPRVFRGVDRFFGGVFGLIQSVIIWAVVSLAVNMFAPAVSEQSYIAVNLLKYIGIS